MSTLNLVLTNLAICLPSIAAYLLIFVLAIVRFKSAPQSAVLVLISVGLLLLTTLSATIVYPMIPRIVHDTDKLFLIHQVVRFAFNLLESAALIMLVTAVFIGRKRGQITTV